MQKRQPNALTDAALRYGYGYLAFLRDGWRRSWDIGSRYAGEAVVTAARAAVEPEGRQRLLPEFLNGLSRYAVEMALVPASALETAATKIDLKQFKNQFKQPEPHAIHEINGKQVMLPVRFGDATHGWAMYAVDATKAQKALDAAKVPNAPGKVPNAPETYGDTYEVLEVAGQAYITVYGVDFKKTDLGPYRELGVEIWVRPKANLSTFPGTLVIKMAVDKQFSVDAANKLWNFGKLMAPGMSATYNEHAHTATFSMKSDDEHSLAITVPRFGRSRTTDLPIRYYSVSPDGSAAWSCVFNRSSEHEGMQYGGNVELRLGDSTGGHCFCALKNGGGRKTCLCLALKDMGLPKVPICNGWAQDMTGQVDAPVAVGAASAVSASSGAPKQSPARRGRRSSRGG